MKRSSHLRTMAALSAVAFVGLLGCAQEEAAEPVASAPATSGAATVVTVLDVEGMT